MLGVILFVILIVRLLELGNEDTSVCVLTLVIVVAHRYAIVYMHYN